MKLGIPTETRPRERRVAATPETVGRLVGLGFEVLVEAGAGAEAGFPDAAYAEAGARVEADGAVVWAADVVTKVAPPTEDEADRLREGAVLVSLLRAANNPELLARLAARRVTALALEGVPRITRAQKMDVLSSMGNLAGYRAVVEAASRFPSFFSGQITAAGRVPPAKVLIIGAGVAGLAAVAAARGLGAVVRAFDTRAAAREQVQSLGAEFLEVTLDEAGEGEGGYAKVMSQAFIDAEMALFRQQAAEVDVVITTALIPGRRAPILLTRDMVEAMRPGSVVVDLAAEMGGNCELTVADEDVVHQGVTVVGATGLPNRMAPTASQLFATNVANLLEDLGGAQLRLDQDDEIVYGATVTLDGQVVYPRPRRDPPAPAPTPTPAAEPAAEPKLEVLPPPAPAAPEPPAPKRGVGAGLVAVALVGAWLALKLTTAGDPASPGLTAFLQHLTVFVLACFVGWQVVWSVTPALHTPLMSVTNAISGIIIVGGMLQLGSGADLAPLALGAAAILFATINIAGGFLVTQRMLRMFRK